MFHINSDGRCFLRVEDAPLPTPLISVVQFGLPHLTEAIHVELQRIGQESNAAWSSRISREPLTGLPLEFPPRDLGAEPDMLCVLAANDDPKGLSRARKALEASTAFVKFLMLKDEGSISSLGTIKTAARACFGSPTLALLLTPLRWMSAPPGLIGIDLDDHMTVCAGRWVYLETVAISVLSDVISTRPPFQGLTLSFGPLSLNEIDAIVDYVKAAVTEDVDFVWHDAPWHSDKNTVDVCFAYDNPLEDVPDR